MTRFHRFCWFELLWTSFSSSTDELGSLLIWEAVPYTITSNYNKVVLWFDLHFLDIWERWHLMLLTFFQISVRSRLWWQLCITLPLPLNRLLFLAQFSLQLWVLVLPVTNCSWHGDNTLNSTIIDEAASCFYSLHFSCIIRFVIMTQLRDRTTFANKDRAWVTWVWTINMLRGHEAYASSTPRLKWNRFCISFLHFLQFCRRSSNCLFHLQQNRMHLLLTLITEKKPIDLYKRIFEGLFIVFLFIIFIA